MEPDRLIRLTGVPADATGSTLCSFCGTPTAGKPHALVGKGRCCEGCYLSRRVERAPVEQQDDLYVSFAEALVAALDARERETGLHSKRVACHTLVLARRFINDRALLRQVYWGALLHDIGKIGIPDRVLLKDGPLTGDEWTIMRTHPEVGYRILAGVPFLAGAGEIVLCHEERYDGSGYPRGLAGEAIPLSARLFAVIDTLDAMTSDRSYRKAQAFDAATSEIRGMAGVQFDPLAVEALFAEENTLREMVEMKCNATTVP